MKKRPVWRLMGRLFLALAGWTPDGARPEPEKYVLIAAPHTSNWDFIYLQAFAAYYEVRISWIGKHTLFRWPFGSIMRALGGVPVRRGKRENMVTAMARAFDAPIELGLVVPAEGTRGYVDYWKSGFYHIAITAHVPIVMSYLDYAKKTGGFGPGFMPTGDVHKDMDRIREFYEGRLGKYPALFGPIRLKEEDSEPQ